MSSKRNIKRKTGNADVSISNTTSPSPACKDEFMKHEHVYYLGNWISKIFKIDITKANKISKALFGVAGLVITAVTVGLTI